MGQAYPIIDQDFQKPMVEYRSLGQFRGIEIIDATGSAPQDPLLQGGVKERNELCFNPENAVSLA